MAPQLVSWPIITEEDKKAVLAVLDRGVLSGPLAPEVRALEREFADYIGVPYCLATNSGTSALHMALEAIGIQAGDEVIVPAFTFVATAMAVLQQGAIPVFADIEDHSLGLDPMAFQQAITSKTKAVIPVHIHGMPCDLDAILEIARQHDIPVIEDACQAHGALYHGQKVGSFGRLATFSLQSSKNLAAGEGGLLVTHDEACYQRAARFRMFGENIFSEDYDPNRPLDLKRSYDSISLGYMYRTQELSAALARSQLKNLDTWNQKGFRNAQILQKGLCSIKGLTLPYEIPGRASVYHKYRIRLRESPFRLALQNGRITGLETGQWQTKIVPEQTLFKNLGYHSKAFPKAQRLIEDSFCLFSHSHPIWVQSEELCQHYVQLLQNLLS